MTSDLGRRTRVLIVDDSAVMRSLLRAVVRTDEALEVAGTAADGEIGAAGGGDRCGRTWCCWMWRCR